MSSRSGFLLLLAVGTQRLACSHGWNVAGYDQSGSAFNASEHRIGPHNVGALKVDWTFDEQAAGRPVRPMHATPVIDEEGNAYVGDLGGRFYSISPAGTLRWTFAADAPTPELGALVAPELGAPDGAPFLGGAALASERPYVIAGDANGRVYARRLDDGSEVWTARGLDPNPLGGVSGNSVAVYGDTVLVGMSSLENYAFVLSAGGLRVDCCSHQGALVALDLATGAERWRYVASPPAAALPPEAAPFVLGPAGGDIWSQPTLDIDTRTVFVSTGQNLAPAADGHSTPASDAIVALDGTNGSVKWVHQFTQDDIWAVGVPNPNPATGQLLDMDLGDAPKIYRLPNGRKVVGAGQKDGRYHVLDAATGADLKSTQVLSPRNDLGGFQTGGAFAYGTVFEHGLDATAGFDICDTGSCPYEGFDGTVVALSADGSRRLWSVKVPVSPLLGGLAVANHVVYFQSPVEEQTPQTDAPLFGLYAVDAATGAVLKRMTFPGRAISSPVVSDGHVYVTKGNGALPSYGIVPQGGLIRLSVPASNEDHRQ
jgi:polyvinyl alcohol dehydrogenase (cytochrome)